MGRRASTFEKRLASLQKNWIENRKEKDVFGGPSVDDGLYIAKLDTMELMESSNGNIMIASHFIVLEGSEKGNKFRDYQGISNDVGQRVCAGILAKLGYEVPEDISDVEAILKEITKEKPTVRVRVSTKETEKGTFTHAVIQRRLESDYEPEEGAQTEEEPEEEPEAATETKMPKKRGRKPKHVEEEPEEEPEAEDIVLEKGMRVNFTFKGEEHIGEVLEFTDDDTKARIESEDDGKIYRIAVEKLSPAEGETEVVDVDEPKPEEEEEEETPEEKKPRRVRKVK